MSKNPGIGANYVQRMMEHHRFQSDQSLRTTALVTELGGFKKGMPRYYKNKFFTNRYQKALIQRNMLEYAAEHPSTVDQLEHDNLLKKLNRKFK